MTDLKSIRMKVVEGENDVGKIGHRRVNFRDSKYEDLRQLEAAIRDAYVAKELKAQIVEAEAARIAAQAQERFKNEMFKRAVEEAAKIDEEERKIEKSAKLNYGVELQTAITSRQNDQALALEFERRERRVLEEVSKVIEERQEARKISKKLEFAERSSRELRIFQELKEIRLQKEAEELEAKRQQDLKYLEEIDARIDAIKKARTEQKLARETVIEIVSKSLIESREKKLEIEAIIADLIAEEKLFEEEVQLRKDKERRKLAREEAAAEMERHRIIIEERKLRHYIEEEEFAAEVMRRVLEDRRIERLTLEAKRRRQIEYRQALEEIIVERRARRVKEMINLEESLRLERHRSEAFRQRVKDIREKLIRQHAGNVAEFIARKALSDEERIVLDRIIDDLDTRELK